MLGMVGSGQDGGAKMENSTSFFKNMCLFCVVGSLGLPCYAKFRLCSATVRIRTSTTTLQH